MLTTPQTLSSQLFYRRKLSTYNLTVFDIGKTRGFCYMWHEGVGKRGATNVASSSCVWRYMVECSEADCKEFVFFTDNCGGQNKNKFIAAMYLHAVRTLSVERICHIFLERGHTENEGVSVHATIERAARRTNVYAPLQWYTLAGVAKKTGNPYSVFEMEGHMLNFKPVSDHYCKYMQEEVSAKCPDWTKIRSLVVEKDKPDLLFVKYCFEEERYTQVHIGRNQTTSTFGPVPVLPKDSSVTDPKNKTSSTCVTSW